MPTFLVTWSPPATHPGLLARAGPEPSPRGAQGPQAGLGTPGANTSGIGSTAEQKETPRQARFCQLNATTGCTGVPAGCSAASTAGPGTRGHPVSLQPPPTAHPRLWGALESPRFGSHSTVTSPHTLERSPPHTEPQAPTCAPMGAGHRNTRDGDGLSGQGPHHGDAG